MDYLQDRKKLAAVVERIGEKQAWKLVLEAMLDSDLKLLVVPPDLSKVRDRPLEELSLRADAVHDPDGDVTTYRGNVQGSIGHNAQETVTNPAYDSGKLNLDGTPRPPLDEAMKAALARLHLILDKDMRAGAIVRKFVQNSDVGGILYGRTVITSNGTAHAISSGLMSGSARYASRTGPYMTRWNIHSR